MADHHTSRAGRGQVFAIDRIMEERTSKSGMEYLVKWTGYRSSANSWVPEKDLLGDALADWRPRLRIPGHQGGSTAHGISPRRRASADTTGPPTPRRRIPKQGL